MRHLKRTPVLALVATALALAAPAAASAADWTDEGKPIAEPASISIGGPIGFQHLGSGAHCDAVGEATLTPGGKGEFTSFELEPETCQFFGVFEECEVAQVGYDIGALHATEAGTIEIEDFEFSIVPSGECWYSFTNVVGDGLIATPDSSEAMTQLTIAGEATLTNDFGEIAVDAWGSWDVSPSGRYGIS